MQSIDDPETLLGLWKLFDDNKAATIERGWFGRDKPFWETSVTRNKEYRTATFTKMALLFQARLWQILKEHSSKVSADVNTQHFSQDQWVAADLIAGIRPYGKGVRPMLHPGLNRQERLDKVNDYKAQERKSPESSRLDTAKPDYKFQNSRSRVF